MKPLFLFFFLLGSTVLVGQNMDSLAVAREVDSLIDLSLAHTGRNNDEALKFAEDAARIAKNSYGEQSRIFAKGVFYIGRVAYFRGEFYKAESCFIKSSILQEKLLGRKSIDYIRSIGNLGIVYADLGETEKAIPLSLDISNIFLEISGRDSPDYASSLSNLGSFYNELGQWEKSEKYHLEALSIREKIIGKMHPAYAGSLNNLGNLYENLGQYQKSEAYHKEANEVWEKVSGREHSDYATGLMNLGRLYATLGRYSEGEKLLLDAKELWSKILGQEHPDYASCLNLIAHLYINWGKYDLAKKYILDAISIQEKSLSKEHYNYIGSLGALALANLNLGDFNQAESQLLKIIETQQNLFGKKSIIISDNLNNLSKIYQLTDRPYEAAKSYIEVAYIRQKFLQERSSHLSESELAILALIHEPNNELLFSFGIDNPQINIDFTRMLWDNTLTYKSAALETFLLLDKSLSESPNDSLIELQIRWRGLQRRIAILLTNSISEQTDLPNLQEKANTLEKELRRALPGFDQALQQVNWQNVRDSLKKNEAAVEFVRFRYYTPDPTDSILYAALVLRPGDESPHFVYLCTEAQLNTVLARWNHKNVEISPAEVYYDEEGKTSLYSLLWKPLEALLPQGTVVWYAPAGLLHRLNPDAIYHDTTPLAERYTLRRIGSTRQIALQPSARAYNREALLFGGLRYASDTIALKKALAGQGIATRSASLEERKPASPEGLRDIRSDSLRYLPESQTEVKNISKTLRTTGFNARMFTGFEGTEEVFLQMGTQSRATQQNKKGSPRILHLATHGYFFPDPNTDSLTRRDLSGMDRHIPYRASDNPFIRSGLLLSGCEQAWRTGSPASSKLADGILTAADIAALDLSGTELTVLSACETGLGDVESNEGVYGLQRAFKIAGSRYLIMSLWKVEDTATMELMTDFYAKWLDTDKPASIPDAFRAAQAKLREKYKDPFYWAGFVLVE